MPPACYWPHILKAVHNLCRQTILVIPWPWAIDMLIKASHILYPSIQCWLSRTKPQNLNGNHVIISSYWMVVCCPTEDNNPKLCSEADALSLQIETIFTYYLHKRAVQVQVMTPLPFLLQLYQQSWPQRSGTSTFQCATYKAICEDRLYTLTTAVIPATDKES